MADKKIKVEVDIETNVDASIKQLKELKKQLKDVPTGTEQWKKLYNEIDDLEDKIKGAKKGSADWIDTLENAGGPLGMLGKGLNSAKVAFTSLDTAFKATGIEQKIMNERDFIMKRLNLAHRKGRDAEFDRIIDKEVDKFNTKNPTYMIEDEDIYNSLLKQAELRESSIRGVNLTEKNAILFDEALDIMEKQAAKEKKQK
jgi:hypothetical protein